MINVCKLKINFYKANITSESQVDAVVVYYTVSIMQ